MGKNSQRKAQGCALAMRYPRVLAFMEGGRIYTSSWQAHVSVKRPHRLFCPLSNPHGLCSQPPKCPILSPTQSLEPANAVLRGYSIPKESLTVWAKSGTTTH